MPETRLLRAARALAAVAVDEHAAELRGEPQRGRRVARAGRIDALLHGGDERHDLERRARPALAVGGEVELRVLVLRRGRHRADVAVARVDAHDRRRRCALEAQAVGDRLARLLLEFEVDRRPDPQPAAAHELLAVALDELVGHVVEEVALALGPEELVRMQLERLGARLRGLDLADVAEVGHLLQDLVAARDRDGRRAERVVLAWRLGQAGQQRGLGERQARGALVEVRARRRRDADRLLAAVRPVGHGVEVLGEDPLLALLAGVDVLELLGELGLAHLALERLLAVARVQRADELHRQRRAALDRLARVDVLDRRADDAFEVDAAVLVEALVLDRDRRVAHVLGHVRAGDRVAQDVVGDLAELGLVVEGEDPRVAARGPAA